VNDGQQRLLLANLAERPQQAKILGFGSGKARLFRLDGSNVDVAKSVPGKFQRRHGQRLDMEQDGLDIELAPDAIVRIDRGSGARHSCLYQSWLQNRLIKLFLLLFFWASASAWRCAFSWKAGDVW